MTGTRSSTHEGRISLLAQLAQPSVQHGADESIDIIITQVFLVVLRMVRSGITLHIDMNHRDRLFLVLLDIDNHLVVVGNGVVDALGRVHRLGNLREERLHLPLHLVNVNIAYYHNGLQVGTIPFLVIVAQVLIGEMIHDIHRADGQTVLILRPFIDIRQRVFLQALHSHSCTSCAPFLVNDTTLLVYLLILQQDVMAPVVEHQQTGVEDTLALQGC